MSKPVGIITASSLNIRPNPSTVKAPIGRLKRGAAVEIQGRVDGWYKIKYRELIGYIHNNYVKVQKAATPSGFLCKQGRLKAIKLAPVKGECIAIRNSFSSRQKKVAQAWNSQGNLLRELSNLVGIDPGIAVAVLCVESGGSGFGEGGRIIIRFENHHFKRYWGKFLKEIFNKHFRYSPVKSWTEHKFRKTDNVPWETFHRNQAREWRVFNFARSLNEVAAMLSISMGGPQIMGSNHKRIGYGSVEAMFDNFQSDIRYHILGFFDFIKGGKAASKMVNALKQKNFKQFATYYNGPGQAAKYGLWIKQHYDVFTKLFT